ncbi:MAG: glycosyltransferase family 4 protein [Deltaproteobacteria bacterium]|nr:glycosyltransferase family 4 protein [Deltaproteobacteria bacterium]MBW2447088.1 glycosyltransferase family 4 protein [Deltaproteobacteria bacterium]
MHDSGSRFGSRGRSARYALWLGTSDIYSGGRIHLYQLAWCLASRGAQVDLLTDRDPLWVRDYPRLPGLSIRRFDDECPRAEPDVIVTDGREPMAAGALAERRRYPDACLVGMSFETRDWVERHVSATEALRFVDRLPILSQCDRLLAASEVSARHLRIEMRGRAYPALPVQIFEPAVNSFAVAASRRGEAFPASVPYAFMVGRPAEHKNWAQAIDAIWALDVPFDLVAFGRVRDDAVRPDTSLHRLRRFDSEDDVMKFRALRGAEFVLAPSTFEGFGMVPAEALCCGVPCVAYDLPVLRQVYEDRLVYVPWNDARALAETVARMVADPISLPGSAALHRRRYGLAAQRRRIEALGLAERHSRSSPSDAAQPVGASA